MTIDTYRHLYPTKRLGLWRGWEIDHPGRAPLTLTLTYSVSTAGNETECLNPLGLQAQKAGLFKNMTSSDVVAIAGGSGL